MSSRQKSDEDDGRLEINPAMAPLLAMQDPFLHRMLRGDCMVWLDDREEAFRHSLKTGRFRGFGRLVKVTTFDGVEWRTLRRGEAVEDSNQR